jgi:hypothetical protein
LVADGYQAPVLPCSVGLPVVLERLLATIIEINGPKINEIEPVLDGPLLQGFEFLFGYFRE